MAEKVEKEVKSASNWNKALKLAKKAQDTWETRGDKIVKRYRDDRGAKSGVKYNILWSNIRTLLPAVYGKKPKAQAERRNKDKDPIARAAAEILERTLQYEIDHYNDYDSGIKNAILDRLLAGRGVVWVRYEKDGAQVTEDVSDMESGAQVADDASYENEKECSPTDYVFWKDFRHSPARTWEEVTWIARRVYIARDEGVERFGNEFKNVDLTHVPIGLDDKKNDSDEDKKAIVWEIWDKATKTALWVAEDHPDVLDERPDPLELDEFYPCPKPLFATLTTDTLIPVADYIMYQDQAEELDELSARIVLLAQAVKVAGVYDASATGIARLLDEGVENKLVPVDKWAAFAEKGGLKGTIDFLPLETIVGALQQLYIAREQCKQVIYEVTGLSDIIRGASKANETATAQNIKSQYASLRLKEMQNDVARFASDLLKIKAQIICNLYNPQTIIEMSGIQATIDGQNGQQVMQAIELLKSGSMRNYKIEVASDSLVEIDEQGEKQSRMEFLAAAGGFIEKAIKVPPELIPLMGEMLMFGVRGFKAGRTIEGAFDEAMQAMQAPKPPQADPAQQEEQKAKDEATNQQMTEVVGELDNAKQSLQGLQEQNTKMMAKAELDRIEIARLKAEASDANNKFELEILNMKVDAKIDDLTEVSKNADEKIKQSEGVIVEAEEKQSEIPMLVESLNNNMAALMQANMQSMADMQNKHAELVAVMTRPKTATLSSGKTMRIE
jgi:hypothetical protein